MSPVAVMIGAPGAGKSTIGKRLAKALGVDFVDTDALIEAEAGMAVADIFVNQGEPAFRELEARIVATALIEQSGVVSLGGGAILDPKTRERLHGHPVVWLRVTLSDAAKRVGMNAARPLLLGNVRQQLGALLKARTPLYEEVASITVDTSGRKVREVVDEVVAALGVAPRESDDGQ